jgi:hypothetical protein
MLRFLLLLASVFGVAGQARAAETARNTAATHYLRPGTAAVADLDGDHVPDVASGIRTGHTHAGYSYRVDLDLSENPEARSFSVVSQEPGGLSIEAIDIDGDHDLDLVIRGQFSLQPIGIWLNDGSGRFTEGDLKNYALSAQQTQQSVQSPDSPRPSVGHFEWRRPQLIPIRQRTHQAAPSVQFQEIQSQSVIPSQYAFGSVRLRAPPALNA